MLLPRLKSLLLQLDLFWSTDYFRYREQPQYRTLTGGFCSIILIIICAVIFSNSIIGTFSKDRINWQYGVAQQTDLDFSVKVNTDSPAKFMFAIGVNDMDLTASPRYFDFALTQEINIAGAPTINSYTLQPCKRSDWQGAGQKILSIFDRKKLSTHLCPVLGDSFFVTGMSTSNTYKYVKVSALQCDPNSELAETSPCADRTVLDQFLASHANFILNFYFVNVLINPSNPEEVSYYLEDRNYVPFNFAYGGEVNLYMSRYSILTDEQILPFEDTRMSQGGIVNYVGQYVPSRKFGPIFGSINIKKSALSMDLVRNYTKLDSTLSYVGGLFGFFMVLFIFMRVYTQYSYEVQMADRLYSYDRQDPLRSQNFHFGAFMGYILYRIGCLFGQVKWSAMQRYHQSREQIQKQFDVCFLMRRVIFLQRSLRVLLEDHQFKGLHMHEKMTLREAQELRGFYRLRDKVRGEDGQSENSEQSAAVNVTEDLLENQEALPRDDSSGLEMELKDSKNVSEVKKVRSQKASKRGRIASSSQMQETAKSRQFQNKSEAMLRPQNSVRGKQSLKETAQLPSPTSSHALKLLQKDSLSGNRISRRIYEGFSTDLLKSILLRIEQDREERTDHNEIVINENEQDYQIRISKRYVRPKERQDGSPLQEQQRKGQQKEQKEKQPQKQEKQQQNLSSPIQVNLDINSKKIANEFQYI